VYASSEMDKIKWNTRQFYRSLTDF
jgi:hypothetical protein